MGRLVSVVLVTWNSAQWLRRCLDGVAQQTPRARELIVVDNASSDDSLSLVRSGPPSSVHGPLLICNERNVGFAAAVNRAIRIAKGDFVQLVNPDCFLEPDYIEKVLEAFHAEDVGMAQGKLLREDGSGIDSMGIRMTRTGRHLDIQTEDRGPRTEDRHEVFGVSGAAAMYRASFLDDVAMAGEPFDEDFFAYREDADIAWRGRLLGWRAMCVPGAIAHHVRRVTPEVRRSLPPEINMHSLKNRFLLRLKNEGWYLALRNAPFELVRDAIAIAAALTIERTSLPAFSWLWRNRRNILAERHAIQMRRRVSDFELAKWFR